MSVNRSAIYLLIFLLLLTEGCSTPKKTTADTKIIVDDGPAIVQPAVTAPPKKEIKKASTIQEKYALYLNIPPEKVTNLVLYQFIDKWLYTPYLWGGTGKNGIDCSAFMQKLLADVYNINVPRTSFEQFGAGWIERFASSKALSEGDLVFFRTMDDKIVSHVGMYLSNGMFINASSSKGVSIASMNNSYWRNCFVAAGRIRSDVRQKSQIKK